MRCQCVIRVQTHPASVEKWGSGDAVQLRFTFSHSRAPLRLNGMSRGDTARPARCRFTSASQSVMRKALRLTEWAKRGGGGRVCDMSVRGAERGGGRICETSVRGMDVGGVRLLFKHPGFRMLPLG